jgi:hypothetical protein
MKTLSDYFGKTLHFIQLSLWKRTFELKDGDQVIGTLTYPKFFSVRAYAKIFDTNWEFYEPHWWRQLVEILEVGKELPVAKYNPPVFKKKGLLELPHGESVFLCSNFFRTHEIKDKHESRLVLFKTRMSIKMNTEIQIEKRSEILDKHPWVLLLIIYVEINKNRRRS